MELTMPIVCKYLDACENQKNLDWKTVKAYGIDLRQFTAFLTGGGADFGRESIKAYISSMNRKYKPRTVKRKIASVRALVTWLLDEQLLDRNPFENLRARLPKPATLPRVIPLRVVESMLEAAHKRLRLHPEYAPALCGTAAMETLFATGMRVSELSGLKTRDIDLKDGVIRILGKGKKERVIHITNAEVLSILRRYAKTFQPGRDGFFFRNRRGNRLSEQSVRNIIRKYGEMAGYPVRITPHMFRHTTATLLLEADVDIRCIQQLLGHASIVTTQIYTHVAGAKQREIMMTKHPRNRFSFQQDSLDG